MLYSFEELRRKEVIDVNTGERLGYIDDVELSVSEGKAEKLVIYGNSRLFGFLGKEDDIIIRCSDIRVVGREVVLVERQEGIVHKKAPKEF
ncbi:MAG: YlmC/YmxH family sporulation protein [Ruminococcus sp.]|nr:YlmC/YmxH family sporulation protein [Ruminococcus sp.]